MTEVTIEPNGNTLAWRLGRAEAELERKADHADVERLEAGQRRIETALNRLIFLALTATVSACTMAILQFAQP